MNGKIKTINLITGGERMLGYIGIGLATVAGATIIVATLERAKDYHEISKIRHIIDHTYTGELADAIEMANETELGELGQSLVDFAIERKAALIPLEEALANGQYETAREILPTLDHMLDNREIIQYTAKVEAISEEGLYQRIQTDALNRSDLSQQYLEWYPEGQHADTVLQNYLTHELNTVGVAISESRNLETVQNAIIQAKSLLTEYQDAGITLPQYIHDRFSNENIRQYVENAHVLFPADEDEDNLRAGDILELNESSLNQHEGQYYSLHQGARGVVQIIDSGGIDFFDSVEVAFSIGDETIQIPYKSDMFSALVAPTPEIKAQFLNTTRGLQSLLQHYNPQ